MEKFQIAKYGLMQVTAIIYGIMATGACAKFAKTTMVDGYPLADGYYHATFFRDYGFLLLIIPIIWVTVVAFLSSPLSKWTLDARSLAISGIILTILLALIGSSLAIGGFTAAIHPTFIRSS